MSLVGATFPLIGAHKKDETLIAMAPSLALGQCLFIGIAFFSLMAAHVTDDFSVLNVVQNSHTLKPMLYKIAGVWGNHEGSLLLWTFVLSLFSAGIALTPSIDAAFKARVLAVQAIIAAGFFLFSLLTSNPFIRVSPMPIEGNGLNPVLQDPGLAFHPPFLYLGYVGFSVAFSFAVAGLIQGKVDESWARYMRPWVLIAWSLLTVGISMGSWWAYYELGWGGFWFWDPVENASLMPWIAGTALLHSVKVVERRGALKHWTVLLSILAFGLSLMGTFLVRSGILSSVHSFANDPERGLFVLIFLVLAVGGALALYGIRAAKFEYGRPFHPVSREGGLVLNNFILFICAIIVFLGTLYPLFLDAVSGTKISVGPPYYAATVVPLFFILMLSMGAGPLLPWTARAKLGSILFSLIPAAIVGALALGFALFDMKDVMSAFGFGIAVWVICATAQYGWRVWQKVLPGGSAFERLMRIPRGSWGLMLAHAGVGIVVMGITAAGAWQQSFEGALKEGQSATVGGYTFTLEKVEQHVQGPNYDARRATFTVAKNGKVFATMRPETRLYDQPVVQTTEAAIRPRLNGDIYVVIGDPNNNGGYAVRLYTKPLVSWIWGGALIMGAGGVLALLDRRRFAKRQKSAAPAAAEAGALS
jgi:cytochrome c-type biogenesis protein CcmF